MLTIYPYVEYWKSIKSMIGIFHYDLNKVYVQCVIVTNLTAFVFRFKKFSKNSCRSQN